MPKYTPKEAEFYDRFGKEMGKTLSNPNQSIGTSIEDLASNIPDKDALLFEDSSWTWKEFNEESNLIANYFLNSGLEPGNTVALMLENSPEYLFYTTGINKLQGISALLNFNLRKQALIHSFKLVEPKWIIVDGDSLHNFVEIVEELGYPYENIYVVNNAERISHDFKDLQSIVKNVSKKNPTTTFNSIIRQTAFYIFTSGTTGLPKACVMENYKLFVQGNFLGIGFANTQINDVLYIPTPLYHNLAIGVAWPAIFRTGATVAIKKRFSASEYWKDIRKFQEENPDIAPLLEPIRLAHNAGLRTRRLRMLVEEDPKLTERLASPWAPRGCAPERRESPVEARRSAVPRALQAAAAPTAPGGGATEATGAVGRAYYRRERHRRRCRRLPH